MSKCYRISYICEEVDENFNYRPVFDEIYVSATNFDEVVEKFNRFNDDAMKTLVAVNLVGIIFEG